MPAHNGVTGRSWFDASGDVVKELYLLKVSGGRFVEAGDNRRKGGHASLGPP